MITVLLVIHILIALALIVTVLLQRSEGGGLGIGGGSGGMGGFMTARGTANLLTRTTGFLAAAFMAMSLLLAWLAGSPAKERQRSIFDTPPASTAPAVPAAPAAPAAPIAQ